MKNMSTPKKKVLTVLTILALLVMILPAAVAAREGVFTAKLPRQASAQALLAQAGSHLDETESTDAEAASSSANKSDRALAVAARNLWARTHGIPPGHVNLFDKLYAVTGGTDDINVARELIFTRFTTPMTIRDLMKEIKTARELPE